MPKVWLSSTVITPSLPTLSIAAAMASPISVSAAEIDATCAICSLSLTFLALLPMDSTRLLLVYSKPN